MDSAVDSTVPAPRDRRAGGRPPLRALALAAFLAVPLAACAHSPAPVVSTHLATVEVLDRTDNVLLPVYLAGGERWIVGTPGHEYTIRIRNQTGARILAVPSVDGVNAITGETAAPDQSGYVLEPYGSVEIAGWRKSMTRTAAFYFTDLGDSYAARTGRPANVGVIGVAVFQEKEKPKVSVSREPWDWRGRFAQKAEADARAANAAEAKERAESGGMGKDNAQNVPAAPPPPPASAPAPVGDALGRMAEAQAPSEAARADASTEGVARSRMQSPAPMAKLGTGHGRNEDSRVTMTTFERATVHPSETLAVQYDRRENLVAMGVLPQPIAPIARRDPVPFPAMRFAPDPR